MHHIEDNILDFLDGNLAPGEEEELLHRLAVSPERRAMLKEHLQVRELTSALARKHRYFVPGAVTATLFDQLAANGYAGPILHNAHESADALRASLEKGLDRSAGRIVSAARRRLGTILNSTVSFMMGAIIMYALFQGSDVQTAERAVIVQTPSLPSAEQMTEFGSAMNTSTTNNSIGTISSLSTSASDRDMLSAGISDRILNTSRRSSDAVLTSEVSFSDIPTPSLFDIGTIAAADIEGTGNTVQNSANNTNDVSSSTEIAAQTIANPAVFQQWFESRDAQYNALNDFNIKQYFGYDPAEEVSYAPFERTTASIRVGGGALPGQMYGGSLSEFKLSADITDWLVAKVSFGQFMPYETEAMNAGLNADGVRQLKLQQMMQYKGVVGAELGIRMSALGIPLELMGGVISDLKEGMIPRASLFTNFKLFDNLSLHIGAEAVLYEHNVNSSIIDKQNVFMYEHPVMLSAPKSKELSGFIGPAIEMAWHF